MGTFLDSNVKSLLDDTTSLDITVTVNLSVGNILGGLLTPEHPETPRRRISPRMEGRRNRNLDMERTPVMVNNLISYFRIFVYILDF